MSEPTKSKKSQPMHDGVPLASPDADTAVARVIPSPKISYAELLTAYTAVIYVLCGRGRVGKTFIGNLLIKRLRRAGQRVQIIDADDSNDGLRAFYDQEVDPENEVQHRGEREETSAFIRRMIDTVTVRGGFAVWDAGGNDGTLNAYAASTRFASYLQAKHIAIATIYVFGDDLSDLSNIDTLDQKRSYEAQKVILCANAGAPPTKGGASAAARTADPFAEVRSSPVIEGLVRRGAGLMTIPRFDFTDQLNELDLDLFDAIDGKPGKDGTPLGPSTEFEIGEWWKEVEAAFAEQEAWLP